MTRGYGRGGKPDANWWLQQIQEGIDFRKKVAFEDKWDVWHAYSRGVWDYEVLPINLFFTMVRTIVPRVYFRNPSVSVVSTKPGPLFMGFAKLLERTDSKLLRQMRIKNEIKMMVQDAFLYGTGIGTLGFGAEYSYQLDGFVEAPLEGKEGYSVEYRDHISPNMPWFSRVHPRCYVVPNGTDRMVNTRWTALLVERTVEDVHADSRLLAGARRSVGPGRFGEESKRGIGLSSRRVRVAEDDDRVELAVVRDRKSGQVFVLAPNAKDQGAMVLYWGVDILQKDGFPDFPLVFNPDSEFFWGVPDSQILEPQQLEINEVRTQIMKHRRATLVKFIAQKGAIDEGEIEKLFNEDVGAVLNVNQRPDTVLSRLDASDIPDSLFVSLEQTYKDVRDTVGFSRNQFGEFNSQTAETTATEVETVRQSSEIRVDERRDIVTDLLVDLVEGMHRLIFEKWTQTEVAQVVGPGGLPVWVKFTPQMLSIGQYHVKVDPDNALPMTKASREQKALALYNVLQNNPLIDPYKLTQYILHELHGTAFDDMMKAMPAVGGGGQSMNALEYGDLIRESMNRTTGPEIVQNLQRGAQSAAV